MIRVIFSLFYNICHQTSFFAILLISTKDALSSCRDAVHSSCLDQNLVYGWKLIIYFTHIEGRDVAVSSQRSNVN